MGHVRYHRKVLVGAAVMVILIAACGGEGGHEATASGDTGAMGPPEGEGVVVDLENRCDVGFNTASFNDASRLVHHIDGHHGDEMGQVDFTLEQWSNAFVDEELGMTAEEVLDELDSDEIYRRHVLGGVLTHTLTPDPWVPMTDPAQCEALAGELRAARDVGARHATVSDALAAGYTLGDSYFAGLGVHYQNWDHLDAFDPAQPVQLLYDGTEPDSRLVGLSYVVRQPGDVPPEGFTGSNDQWHRHRSYCLDLDDGGVNLSSDVLTPEECAAVGGTHVPNPDGWMLHVWLSPGCESDWGVFSGANPRLPYIPDGASFDSGCNSGKTVADPLDLDDRGDGPVIS